MTEVDSPFVLFNRIRKHHSTLSGPEQRGAYTENSAGGDDEAGILIVVVTAWQDKSVLSGIF